ncbi:MAG TPA: hypothetical protein VKB62_15540 [Streptosporangiaceae bacterium]|nr:hypothetical protein [Streptosporangiaceae bacterium]
MIGSARCKHAIVPGTTVCSHHGYLAGFARVGGGRHPKLSPSQRDEIVRRYQAGGVTYAELARQYQVADGAIGAIISQARKQ